MPEIIVNRLAKLRWGVIEIGTMPRVRMQEDDAPLFGPRLGKDGLEVRQKEGMVEGPLELQAVSAAGILVNPVRAVFPRVGLAEYDTRGEIPEAGPALIADEMRRDPVCLQYGDE